MYQKITILGNLGRDPEMRYTQGGKAVTNFSMAANRSYTNSEGEQVDETTWFRISTWGRLAENCNKYLRRGSRVLVEGRLNPDRETGGPRIWERQDGTPSASFEVTAQTVKFLTPKGSEQGADQEGEEDEIPF